MDRALVKMYSADYIEILHMLRQYNCRGVCKIDVSAVEHILN